MAPRGSVRSLSILPIPVAGAVSSCHCQKEDRMTFVRQLLQGKPTEVWTVTPEATVYKALELLAEKNIGAVPVLDGDDLVGMFSERDYARKVILQEKSSRLLCVGD